MVIVPVVAFAYAPSQPTLTAVPGEKPAIALLEWSASDTAVRYAVSVATTPAGPYRIVGETDAQTMSYTFTDGIGGVAYYFRVTALNEQGEQSAPAGRPAGPVTSAWATDPHGVADRSTNKCQSCHVSHEALATPLMRTEIATSTPSQVATCLSCHGGPVAGAADVSSGAHDAFGLASGHALDTVASAGGLTTTCTSCHDPHASSATNPMLREKKINGTDVSTAGNEWCLACHDDDSSWHPAAYPPSSAPQIDAAGYPVVGTWPGRSTYGGAGNAHRLIPETTQTAGTGKDVRRSAGDCLYCHAAHRGANAYDGLVATYRPTTTATLAADKARGDYAALCFTCHGGSVPSGFATAPVDIKRHVTGDGVNAGHSIVTSGGILPPGAPLPCYECHNPHGSTGGNDSLVSDVRGASISTTGTPATVRRFCFTCHTTPRTARGWESAAETYTAVAPAEKVVGIPRSGGVLVLPEVDGHDQGDDRSCYVCHGSNYGDGGKNVHNPASGTGPSHVSNSRECFGSGCHAESRDVADVHAEFVGSPAAKYPQYDSSCELCHENDDPDRIDWDAQPGSMSCARCHPAYHDAPEGQAVPHDGRDAAHTPTSASDACVGCHDASLPEIHGATYYAPGNCASCHAPVALSNALCDTCHASEMAWNKSADCNGCHAEMTPANHGYDSVPPTTTSDAVANYAGDAVIHLTAEDNDGGTGVDKTYYILDGLAPSEGTTVNVPAPSNGSEQHTLQFYSVDKGSNVESPTPEPALTFTVEATGDTTPPSGTMEVQSGASFTTGPSVSVDSTVTDDASGITEMSIDPGTGEFGPWTPYTAASEITLPEGDGEKIVRVQYRDDAGNATTLIDTIVLDTAPPSTTSDAVAAYVGVASITLTATDTPVGSGVASTRYRIDDGAEHSGTSVSVTPPASGSVSHTVYFWSVDNSTNQEAENSTTFDVAASVADADPPTGSVVIDADDTWTTSSDVTLELSASDTGGSGLSQMRFSNDDSSWSAWESYSDTASWTLAAGEGPRDAYAQFRDAAGNISTSATDRIAVDTLDPVTTCTAESGATYSGAQLFSLSPSDVGGSGIASTWWQLDSTAGAWTSGTSVLVAAPASGTVSHTIYWYSRDAATNEETVGSVTFSVSAPESGGTATLSFRTDATFGGWSYVYWEVRDAEGNAIPGMSFSNDDTGHPEAMWADFEVPAGQGYIMYGSWGPMPDGPDEESATYVVTPAETTPGSTVTWWWY